jgi:hypothetical protein
LEGLNVRQEITRRIAKLRNAMFYAPLCAGLLALLVIVTALFCAGVRIAPPESPW